VHGPESSVSLSYEIVFRVSVRKTRPIRGRVDQQSPAFEARSYSFVSSASASSAGPSSPTVSLRLRAAPRISPKEAPESVEP